MKGVFFHVSAGILELEILGAGYLQVFLKFNQKRGSQAVTYKSGLKTNGMKSLLSKLGKALMLPVSIEIC